MKRRFETFKKKIKDVLGGRAYRLGENLSTDWLLILGLFLLCTVFVTSFSLTVYRVTDGGAGATKSATNNVEKSFHQSIDRVISFYVNQGTETERLLKYASTPPIDPSR